LLRRVLLGLTVVAGAAVPALGEEQFGVANPHGGAFFSGKDQRVPMDPTAWPWQAIGRVNVKPVPVKAIAARAFAQEVAAGEVARAGSGVDRQYLLSVHRGCAAALSDRWPGAMLNRCDQRRGDSGSPVLLLRGEQEAFVIGLNAAAGHTKRGEEDYVALGAMGPSAASFADAGHRALEH
jgi:V8-like Glu-specific endopeptidase